MQRMAGNITAIPGKNTELFLYKFQKLEGIKDIFTSPVGCKDRIYIAGTNGTFSVVKVGTEFELISQNKLDDSFYASPVIIDNNLYLRGTKYLYCISEE